MQKVTSVFVQTLREIETIYYRPNDMPWRPAGLSNINARSPDLYRPCFTPRVLERLQGQMQIFPTHDTRREQMQHVSDVAKCTSDSNAFKYRSSMLILSHLPYTFIAHIMLRMEENAVTWSSSGRTRIQSLVQKYHRLQDSLLTPEAIRPPPGLQCLVVIGFTPL